MKIKPKYTDQLTGQNHKLFISVFWKISSKKPQRIGISSKKVVAKAYFIFMNFARSNSHKLPLNVCIITVINFNPCTFQVKIHSFT